MVETLTDASVLIALSNRNDPDHQACIEALKRHPKLLTSWTAFGEAMHVLGKRRGWMAQKELWGLFERNVLKVAEPTVQMLARIRTLMEQYRDLPMDLADASLVALAEARKDPVIFTLDSDFEVYRLPGKKPFQLLP